jgi:ribosomal protein L11 methyltransferase
VIRLALRVRRADAELVLAELLELAPGGVEEIDLCAPSGGEGAVEYAVYGAPGELPDLPDLRAAAGGALVDISTSEVADDWAERWRHFHQPVLVEGPFAKGEESIAGVGRGAGRDRGAGRNGGGDDGAEGAPHTRVRPALFVRPPWEALSDRADALDVVIDPAQAFGTGAHATTRLCLELLLELAVAEEARGRVLDVGAGSGVLAIAAAKLGYEPVVALDNDRESVRAILANAAVNGVEIEARRFDLRCESLPWLAGTGERDGVRAGSPAPSNTEQERGPEPAIVLANLLRPLLLDLADVMPASRPPEDLDLIASGLLREQADEVAQEFARRLGLRERARRERGEWVALWLTSARSPHARQP